MDLTPLAAAIAGKTPDVGSRIPTLRLGVSAGKDGADRPGTIRVTLDGVTVPGVATLGGLPPAGTPVWLLEAGGMLLVLGVEGGALARWINVGDPGAPAFTNGWVNYAGGWGVARFRRDGDTVRLCGLIKSGTLGVSAFTLPAGYRPGAAGNYTAAVQAITSSGASAGTAHTHTTSQVGGRIAIYTDGTVVPYGFDNTYLSLAGITFTAEG